MSLITSIYRCFIKATDIRRAVIAFFPWTNSVTWTCRVTIYQQQTRARGMAGLGGALVSVACVWPAGFKIVPGKLIVSAEQHRKPHRSNIYSLLEWGQDIKGLVSIMKQHCGLAVETESFQDDMFLFLPMLNVQTDRFDLILRDVLLCVILCLVLPLDGIVTLYCVAPPAEEHSKQGMSLIHSKIKKLWSHPVRIYRPWSPMRFWGWAPIVLMQLVWPWSIDCIMKFT